MTVKKEPQKKTVEIDATDRALGRVASEAASFLLGKHDPERVLNRVPSVEVRIVGAQKLRFNDRKVAQKTYTRYSGYPGGLKKEGMAHLMKRKGIPEVIRIAVRGMLPKNKLLKERLKRLTVEL